MSKIDLSSEKDRELTYDWLQIPGQCRPYAKGQNGEGAGGYLQLFNICWKTQSNALNSTLTYTVNPGPRQLPVDYTSKYLTNKILATAGNVSSTPCPPGKYG